MAVAQHNIAVMYYGGRGTAKDDEKALRWLLLAAKQGWQDSQFNLALMYARGQGTRQNRVEAYKWFYVAARNGDVEAAQQRDEIASKLTQTEISKGISAALELLSQGGGHVAATRT